MGFESMMRKRPGPGAVAVTIGERRVRLLDRARIYACGLTPYDVTHLGHAATFVWVDTLTRVLRVLGVEPILCRNVTDIDDVLLEASQRAGTAYEGFAAYQEFRFEGDMAALGVRVPDFEPRAHSYVGSVVRLASALLETGHAYSAGGCVYFRGAHVADRAGLARDEALRLARLYGGRPDDAAKEDPLDVAVWQRAEPGHPAWDSPWGPGRPGWHAECVAMSASVFGVGVDVHAGGADLRFPHHAYHAAMTEALSGVTPYARAWLHVGTVTVDGVKMAKSTGNLVLLKDLLARHPAPVIRLAIIDRAWNRSWDYTPDVVDHAAERLEQLHRASGRTHEASEAERERLRALLATNLDVPAALDTAIEAGGQAARLLTAALGLS